MWRVIFYDGTKAVLITEDGTTKSISVDWSEDFEELIMMAFARKQNILFSEGRTEKEDSNWIKSDNYLNVVETWYKTESKEN